MAKLRHFVILAALAGFAGSAAAGDLATFEVVAKDGRLIPGRLEVPAGKKFRIVVKNEGRGPAEFESAELRVEKVLAPGAGSFVVIHPLKAGTYRFFDEFHPATSEMLLIAK